MHFASLSADKRATITTMAVPANCEPSGSTAPVAGSALRGEICHISLIFAGCPRRLFPNWEQRIFLCMRVIARNVLVNFWGRHPETKVSLERWYKLARAARWVSTDEIQSAAPKAKVLNGERVRFEVAGGNYRLVVAFDFRRQIAFVKFIGSHAQYDDIDPLTVSQF